MNKRLAHRRPTKMMVKSRQKIKDRISMIDMIMADIKPKMQNSSGREYKLSCLRKEHDILTKVSIAFRETIKDLNSTTE